jgi:hypothetical protein
MGTESPTLTQEGAVSEKSTGNDVDYAAKSRIARHRAVLRWLIQYWLANSLPSSTISAIQSWKKEIPVQVIAELPKFEQDILRLSEEWCTALIPWRELIRAAADRVPPPAAEIADSASG